MTDKTRNQLLLVLFLGVLMGALDIAIVAPALPAIQTYYGVGDRALAWTFTILMAKLSDISGRRSVYILDVVLFALGSLIVALSPANLFAGLLFGRALQGLGAGGIFPVASAVIGDTFTPEKRGGALGLIGAVFGLAFLVGPILGGIIMSAATWHWLFIINLPVALVVIVMGWKLLPTQRPDARGAFDWAGMITLGVLLSAFAYGLNQIDTANFVGSFFSLNVLPFILLAAILLFVFVRIENQASDPVLQLTLFKSRQSVLASALSAGAGIGEVSMVFIPALAIAALPGVVDKHTSSYLLMPVVLALGIGSPLAGRMLDKFGSKAVVTVGTILLAAGSLMLGIWNSALWMFIAEGALIGLGLSALLGAPIRYIMLNEIRYIMLNEAPESQRTSAQGALVIFTSVGQLISSALVGAVAASAGGGVNGYGVAYLAIGAISVMLVLLTFGLKSRQQEIKRAAQLQTAATHGGD
ncbi:MAG: MFS transporter [Chloroflexi bacterium CFX1]|nr:MFS transporter [Chloroflexi bacterium CFX1]